MKKKNKQKELFSMITSNNLTPNQYYLLQCFYDAYTPTEINIDAELKELVNKGYVSIVGNIGAVTNKGKALVNKIEKLFDAPVVAEVLDDDYEKNMQEYINIFPAIKLPTGKYARTNIKNLKDPFKWFFKNFDYSWDVILDATERYVNEYEADGYKYMRTCQYFIRKQGTDKSYSSDLANYCEIIINGDVEEEVKHSIKVV